MTLENWIPHKGVIITIGRQLIMLSILRISKCLLIFWLHLMLFMEQVRVDDNLFSEVCVESVSVMRAAPSPASLLKGGMYNVIFMGKPPLSCKVWFLETHMFSTHTFTFKLLQTHGLLGEACSSAFPHVSFQIWNRYFWIIDCEHNRIWWMRVTINPDHPLLMMVRKWNCARFD